MSARVTGHLRLAKGARPHAVEVRARAFAGGLELEVLRSSRQRAAGDLRVVLSASAARDLMRQLQGRADEADRLAYQAAKRRVVDGLEEAVRAIAEKFFEEER